MQPDHRWRFSRVRISDACSRNSTGFLAGCGVVREIKARSRNTVTWRYIAYRSLQRRLVIWLMRENLDYIQTRGYRNRINHSARLRYLFVTVLISVRQIHADLLSIFFSILYQIFWNFISCIMTQNPSWFY